MTVTKAVYGSYVTFTGTMAEVVAAINSEAIPNHRVISILYNGSNIDAVCSK